MTALLMLVFAQYQAQARLSVNDPKKELGALKRGAVVSLVYRIDNTGSAPLTITGFEVACSCTGVKVPEQPILPGKHDSVVVTFNTASVYGLQDRVVLLNSNDPKSPARLRFKCRVSRH